MRIPIAQHRSTTCCQIRSGRRQPDAIVHKSSQPNHGTMGSSQPDFAFSEFTNFPFMIIMPILLTYFVFWILECFSLTLVMNVLSHTPHTAKQRCILLSFSELPIYTEVYHITITWESFSSCGTQRCRGIWKRSHLSTKRSDERHARRGSEQIFLFIPIR